MSFRPVSYQYSEDPTFAVSSTLAFVYTGTPHYFIDGTDIAPVSDLVSLGAVVAEFEADDADGSADPTERVLVTAGGVVVTRSADKTTLAIGTRPPVPFARGAALRELIATL